MGDMGKRLKSVTAPPMLKLKKVAAKTSAVVILLLLSITVTILRCNFEKIASK